MRRTYKGKGNPNHRHGMHGTQTYNSWSGMIKRCTNKNNPKYHIYGGRGITVCDKWLTFVGFLDDMGVSPVGYSIERIDNNESYNKDNCKWLPFAEQARNRRSTKLNVEDVLEIRWLLGLGYKQKVIAADYGVTHYSVSDINNRRSWSTL